MHTPAKLLYSVLFILLIFGCKKDTETSACTEANIQAKVTATSQAATTYGNNPSRANCLAYVNALEAYINTAANCSFVSKADLDDARTDIADARKNCQ